MQQRPPRPARRTGFVADDISNEAMLGRRLWAARIAASPGSFLITGDVQQLISTLTVRL